MIHTPSHGLDAASEGSEAGEATYTILPWGTLRTRRVGRKESADRRELGGVSDPFARPGGASGDLRPWASPRPQVPRWGGMDGQQSAATEGSIVSRKPFFSHVTITHGTLNAGTVAVAADPLDDAGSQASVRRTTATKYPKRTPILEGSRLEERMCGLCRCTTLQQLGSAQQRRHRVVLDWLRAEETGLVQSSEGRFR